MAALPPSAKPKKDFGMKAGLQSSLELEQNMGTSATPSPPSVAKHLSPEPQGGPAPVISQLLHEEESGVLDVLRGPSQIGTRPPAEAKERGEFSINDTYTHLNLGDAMQLGNGEIFPHLQEIEMRKVGPERSKKLI
jgi:hypothetical protein